MRCPGRLGDPRGSVAHRTEARAVGAMERHGSSPHHDGRLELRVLLLLQRHEGQEWFFCDDSSMLVSSPPDWQLPAEFGQPQLWDGSIRQNTTLWKPKF